MSSDEMNYMYEAMTLWDEFMAASIAGYVSDQPKPGAGLMGATSLGSERMVVLAGTSHVRGRVGIPNRFRKRMDLPIFTMVPERWNGIGKPLRDAKLPPSEADWVLYTRDQPPKPELSMGRSTRDMVKEAVFI